MIPKIETMDAKVPTAINVDYSQHPAFRDLQHTSEPHPDIGRYFRSLDALWSRLIEAEKLEDAAVEFQAEHRRLMSDIGPSITGVTAPEYRQYVIQAFDRSANAILKEILTVIAAKKASRQFSAEAERIAATLRGESTAGFPMDPDLRTKIAKSLSPFMDKLRGARSNNNGARCFIAVPSWGEHWKLVKRFLKKNSVEEGISAYSGYPLELSGYALTYSHPDEVWFKQCYRDLNLDAPRTIQMHFDEDNVSAKSMLYLNEIGPDNGPFSYVPRYAAQVTSRSRLAFMKHLDFAHADFEKSIGIGGRLYNRALFGTPQLRKHFARLPAELQGSSGLGDDVLNSTPLSDSLLENERKITSNVGDLALFAGGETIHRGGIVSKGERWALQMLYFPPPPVQQKIQQSVVSTLVRVRNRFRDLFK